MSESGTDFTESESEFEEKVVGSNLDFLKDEDTEITKFDREENFFKRNFENWSFIVFLTVFEIIIAVSFLFLAENGHDKPYWQKIRDSNSSAHVKIENDTSFDLYYKVYIDVSSGISKFIWNSPDNVINEFIEKSMTCVEEAFNALENLKSNVKYVNPLIKQWIGNPIFYREKFGETIDLKDFEKKYEQTKSDFSNKMSEHGKNIHKKVNECLKVLQGNDNVEKKNLKEMETWKNYEKSLNMTIFEGMKKCIIVNMKNLEEQLKIEINSNKSKPFIKKPLKLINEKKGESALMILYNKWMNDFIQFGKCIQRIDVEDENFVDLLVKDSEISSLRNKIDMLIKNSVESYNKFCDVFLKFDFLWVVNQEDYFSRFLQTTGKDSSKNYLQKFDNQIKKYHQLSEDIEKLPSNSNIGWLLLDAKPMKKSLVKLCEVWSKVFTKHLKKKVHTTLKDIYKFMEQVGIGLDKEVLPGDVKSLKEVIGQIRQVTKKVSDTKSTGLFEPLQDIDDFLKKFDSPLEERWVIMLDGAPEKWQKVYKKALSTREKLAPLRDKEAKKLKEALIAFDTKIIEFKLDFDKNAAILWKSGWLLAYDTLDDWNVKIMEMENEVKQNQKLQELFELEVKEYKIIKQSRKDIVMLKSLWDMSSHVDSLFQSWMSTPFITIDIESYVSEARKFRKEIQSFDVSMRKWDAFNGLEGKVKNMITALPLVQDLRSQAMRDRHWKELLIECKKSDVNIDPKDPTFSLKQLIDLRLHEFEEEVLSIVNKAEKERIIEENLIKIEEAWKEFEFTYNKNEEFNCYMLGTTAEIVEELEDNQVKLQNMMAQRFAKYFIDRVTNWQTLLGTIEQNMILWKDVQKKWENLYPIFVLSKDIKTQLPEDAKRFVDVDNKWRKTMNFAKEITNVLEVCTSDTIQKKLNSTSDFNTILTEVQEKLEKCEKALADYLETKRRIFPRFYFISPRDLVDILSKGSFPKQVMLHMSKLVDAIDTLVFEDENDPNCKICVGIKSRRGEIVKFSKRYNCDGQVEKWLNGIIKEIRITLHKILGESYDAFQGSVKEEWLFNFPTQIVIAGSRIWFTHDVNNAFDKIEEGSKNAMKEYYKKQLESLSKLTNLVGKDISSFDRKKIITLITVDVHNRDVVQQLIDEKADSNTVFTWQSQMRYFWKKEEGCQISIADASFRYNYEYIGNCGCLVITPLTDRCYITLTQSLKLILGGAPAGPAGTGKTETTKDLGRSLGMCVYVFNGSEQLDHVSLGNIFKGLSMSGCWGCFDEFNRVKIGVLSVVATQFKSILDALRAKKSKFFFQHEEINLIHTIGVFVTMNPGYAGRTELPENLKALFRPCAMIVPDYDKICEIMLAAEGFLNAKVLSTKFVTIYRLNDELLSKQQHYDWGLRAIKSVLVIAGALKRKEPEIDEELVLMRALRDCNLAKLTTNDKAIFLDLIGDLFPGMHIKSKTFPKLEKALIESAEKFDLQHKSPEGKMFIKKCVQFQELLNVRHSVFILGPAGSGKTQVWKNLIAANGVMGTKTWTHVMNPKAVSSFELYGFMHHITRDWRDGLLSYIMREMSRSPAKKNKWIILDGDIDTEWIESMNTVMDDNKVLTLASNERIPLKPDMRMIFEIDNLKHASPATVSRAGILFLNAADINWMPFMESWVGSISETQTRQILKKLFDKYCEPSLEFIRRNVKYIIPLREIAVIESLCNLLESLVKNEENIPPGSSAQVYEMYFNFAAVWAFGGAIPSENDGRKKFNKWWKKKFSSVKYPVEGTIYDYFVETKVEEGKISAVFSPWEKIINKYESDSKVLFKDIVVSTSQTVKLRYVMDLLLRNRKPVLFVGTAGTGKTTCIQQKLNSLPENDYCSSVINFNSNTDSKSLQAIMEQSIEKKAGIRFAPPGRKKLVYFIDDLNMPNPDKYGTQSAIAFIRQHIDYEYWFNRSKMTKMQVTNTQYISSMNQKAGSFTVSERFQRHFMVLACQFPEKKDLLLIYKQILDMHLKSFDKSIQDISSSIVESTIFLQERMEKEFLPTAVKFYYKFNLRELSNVFQGLCLSIPKFYPDKEKFLKLWIHECCRVYSDRLYEEDLPEFSTIIQSVLKQKLDITEPKKYFEQIPIIFTNFTDQHEQEMRYTLSQNFEELRKLLNGKLEEYNQDNVVMNLELFNQAVYHVSRISRIISNPRGNALLVGVGGSGKQSLSKLATSICGYSSHQIVVTSNYSISEFRDTFKTLFKKCGLKNEEICFIITDSQIVNPLMLVYINDFLSSGIIPNLFEVEEVDEIVSGVANEVRQAGKLHTNKTVCMDYFFEKVKMNLHMILCFSPVGEHFRRWCRKFPAIINCTVIDFFHPWPVEALISVADKFLAGTDVGVNKLSKITEHMAFVHGSVTKACVSYKLHEKRYNYTTPKSFLQLIDIFKKILKEKREELQDKTRRYKDGILKLNSANEKVSQLKAVLEKDRVVVEKRRKVTEDLIKKVKHDEKIVSRETDAAKKQEESMKTIVIEVEALEEEARTKLEEAEPLVEKAKKALDKLNKKEIQELKSFAKPKVEVTRVTEAVLILKSEGKIPKKITWADSKKMMASPTQFIESLKAFDKDNIEQPKVDLLEKSYVNDVSFEVKKITSMSFAAGGLVSWVHNIVAYHNINRTVKPLRKKKKEATERLAREKENLKLVQDKVKNLTDKLEKLITEKNKAEKDLNEILERARKTQEKIQLATRLTSGLGGEGQRWTENISTLNARKKTIVGDVLLASSIISYLGAFTKNYREDLFSNQWISDIKSKGIVISENVDPIFDVLTNDATVAQWNNDGLPSDKTSIENGTIVVSAKNWPLMIDPQLQGIKWIKGREEKNGLKIVQLSQKKYLQVIEEAIRYGYPVLIENIGEEIDSVLDPILSQSVTKKGRQKYIQIGDKEVEYSDKFKLYLQTKLANPHYRPEILAQTTPLNFLVTLEGLEDQLLSVVVNKEKPDLESKRISTLRKEREFKIQLQKCEDILLYELTQEKGEILENRKLIENLEETKKTAVKIIKAVEEIKITVKKIEKSRLVYDKVSKRGAKLYFLIDKLNRIDHMYQFSLESFLVIFNKALEKAEKSDDIDTRVSNIIDSITFTVFNYVSRGLFERHKLIFSTLLCFQICEKEIHHQQLDYLIKGPKVHGIERPENVKKFVNEEAWGSIQALAKVEGSNPNFKTLPKDINEFYLRWKEWSEFEKPENEQLPLEWKNLNLFQKILVIRALRPDRLTMAVASFVIEKIGKKYIDTPQVDLSYSFQDTTPSTPIFFILSPGVDPISQVEELGRAKGFSKSKGNFENISLGDGQEPIVVEMLELCSRKGHWLMLNNLHLVPEWLNTFEKILDKYSSIYARQKLLEHEAKMIGGKEDGKDDEKEKKKDVQQQEQPKKEVIKKVHEGFRLFLSAEPNKSIPIGVLQMSIKLTNEPPSGLRQNLLRALMEFNDSTWENSSKQNEFKIILFSLCFYHATIIERKKYGPQGWNKSYPFNLGDLKTSIMVLNNYLEDKPKIPYEDLRYVFAEILYGGHITNDFDRHLSKTYLQKFIVPDLVDTIELCKDFQSPPSSLNYKGFLDYIDENLPPESPQCFGLHPNAEIGFRTVQGETLFRTILEIVPRTGGGLSGGGGNKNEKKESKEKKGSNTLEGTIMNFIADTLESLPEQYDIEDIAERLGDERTPFQNTFYQECEYMNKLLFEIEKSLTEVKLGIQGMLSITDKMQHIMDSIVTNMVPNCWKAVSFKSIRSLSDWMEDLKQRNEQLSIWRDDLKNPIVVVLSRFFNPQSFLTAIMQSTSRQTSWPLDKMTLIAEITKRWKLDDIKEEAKDGYYVAGLFSEGATWDTSQNCLVESKLKDLYPKMPIVKIKAVLSSVGEKLDKKTHYECPVYKTKMRGGDYVFTLKLKTKKSPAHWSIRGVALLLDTIGNVEI